MSDAHPHTWAADAIRRIRADGPGLTPTPLRRLRLPAVDGVTVYLKDESAFPTGSMKYRLVRAMFRHPIASGEIGPDTPVFAGTGGAVAVAGARFARLLDLPSTAIVPARTPAGLLSRIEQENGRWQRAEGPPAGVQEEARAVAACCGGYVLDHFADAERALTAGDEPTVADEIFDQLEDEPHPVPEWIAAGIGTGATSAVIGRHLRQHGRTSRLAVVDPENSAYFGAWASGCRDYATGMPSRIPGIGRPRTEPGFLPTVLDLVIPVPDAASVAAMRWLHGAAGVAAGPAAGAGLWGLFHLAARMRAAGTRGSLVALVGDGAEPYRTTHLDPEWLAGAGLDPERYEADIERFVRTGQWRWRAQRPGERQEE